MKWRLKALCTTKRENPLSAAEWAVAGFLRDPECAQASEINPIIIKYLLFPESDLVRQVDLPLT